MRGGRRRRPGAGLQGAPASPAASARKTEGASADVAKPQFKVDPFWPKPLPGNQILGQVANVAVDRQDRIWIIQRPSTLVDDEKGALANPPTGKCCTPAAPVLAFDQEGNVVASWGGPDEGFDWPKMEHGIFLDKDNNVWIAGNGDNDHQVLKFSPEGRFLFQIGKAGSTGGSNAPNQLGRPAQMTIDEDANELYVADGYQNRRIVVFDSKTGAYKRHWGAYGNKPSDEKTPPYSAKTPLSAQFSNPVHCVRISNDGLVYVCDRANDRIQVFRKDGTFVKEFRVEPETLAGGSVWDLVLSTDLQQRFIFLADGTNDQIVTLLRDNGEVVTSWGRAGRMAGQFKLVHGIAIDSKGNLYTAEVGTGRRAQKFMRMN